MTPPKEVSEKAVSRINEIYPVFVAHGFNSQKARDMAFEIWLEEYKAELTLEATTHALTNGLGISKGELGEALRSAGLSPESKVTEIPSEVTKVIMSETYPYYCDNCGEGANSLGICPHCGSQI